MNTNNQKPPHRYTQLFNNIFGSRDVNKSIEIISNGLKAIIKNSCRLINDVEYLIESERYASSTFLITTTNEEMAKSYILLDACRINFLKHSSILKRLCHGFYDHIVKYAYIEISNKEIYNMKDAKSQWEYETRKWWPSTGYEENYEPAMPHNTVFLREIPLYVDLLDQTTDWYLPNDDEQKAYFQKEPHGLNLLKNCKEILNQFKSNLENGLFNQDALKILNDEFKNVYINEKTDNIILEKIYKKIENRFLEELSLDQEIFRKSTLNKWPLYHFA